MAYSAAVLCYQIGQLATAPGSAALIMGAVVLGAAAMFYALIRYGRRQTRPLIPVVQLD